MLALLLIVMPLRFREGVAEAIRGTVLFPFLAMQGEAADRQGRYADVARLRAERDSLASFLVGQAGLAQENRELRALLGFRERLGWSFAAAEARRMYAQALGSTTASSSGSSGMLQLSAGADEGVRAGSPVVTAEGLVGMVQKVGPNTSLVVDWTNANFRASAMTTDGETYGIVEPGEAENGERMLLLSPNALHTQPDTGALIVTSGDGQTYPRGIPIGRVVGSGRAGGGWQRTYYIRPLVAPAQAGHVLVLGEPSRAPTDQDLAAAWGVRLTGAPPADTTRRTVAPDAATPAAPAAPVPAATVAPAPAATAAPRPAQPRPRPRPTPGTTVIGRPVDPDRPRVPEGLPPPPNNRREERR